MGERRLPSSLSPVHTLIRLHLKVAGAWPELLQSTHCHPTLYISLYYVSLYIDLLSIQQEWKLMKAGMYHLFTDTSLHLDRLDYGRCSMNTCAMKKWNDRVCARPPSALLRYPIAQIRVWGSRNDNNWHQQVYKHNTKKGTVQMKTFICMKTCTVLKGLSVEFHVI